MPESREGPRVPGEGARELALNVLLDFERRDAYLNLLLSSHLGSSGLYRRDRAFTTELVQGTMRMKGVLDWVLEKYSDRELDDLDTTLLWILRLSAYQMLFISVPDHAACDQGVRMARRHLGGGGAAYAVSYTHLRAHETRHDLVCRLLLEKKKTKKKKTTKKNRLKKK